LFAHGDPLPIAEVAAALTVSEALISQVVVEMVGAYAADDRGITLTEVAGGWQLVTKPSYLPYLRSVLTPNNTRYKLSSAALETLAIVAYRQPITRAEIEAIRGVKAEKAINTLLALDLVYEAGRREGVGRPILYATTERFLLHFGLRSLDDLPKDHSLGPKL
ncbi:MAG: SMC-Scp complex subunit ScpB, partial [Bacillota bacterium]